MAHLKFPRPPSWMVRNALRADDVSWLLRFAWLPSALCFECTKTRDVADTPVSAGARVLINRRKKRKWRRGRRGFDFSNANTSDRCLDTSWCLCKQCTIMPTEVKYISCKELAFLLMNYFIYSSHDFTAREEMNSINWPCSQCVAS